MPKVIGTDLKSSLLTLFNGVKAYCHIPDYVLWANITSLNKGKGEKVDLDNERGIFIVTLLRSILMRLIYNGINAMLYTFYLLLLYFSCDTAPLCYAAANALQVS